MRKLSRPPFRPYRLIIIAWFIGQPIYSKEQNKIYDEEGYGLIRINFKISDKIKSELHSICHSSELVFILKVVLFQFSHCIESSLNLSNRLLANCNPSEKLTSFKKRCLILKLKRNRTYFLVPYLSWMRYNQVQQFCLLLEFVSIQVSRHLLTPPNQWLFPDLQKIHWFCIQWFQPFIESRFLLDLLEFKSWNFEFSPVNFQPGHLSGPFWYYNFFLFSLWFEGLGPKKSMNLHQHLMASDQVHFEFHRLAEFQESL